MVPGMCSHDELTRSFVARLAANLDGRTISRSSTTNINGNILLTLGCRVAALFIMVLGGWQAASAAPAPEPDGGSQDRPDVDRNWRVSERDAANCLYFLLRFHGAPATYSDVVRALGDKGRASLPAVQAAAGKLGLDAGMYQCTLKDLVETREPVIAYVESGGLGHGGFIVVLGLRENQGKEPGFVLALAGGEACLEFMTIEEFVRTWSGFILKPRRPRSAHALAWFLSGSLLSPVVLLLIGRFVRGRASVVSDPPPHHDEAEPSVHGGDER